VKALYGVQSLGVPSLVRYPGADSLQNRRSYCSDVTVIWPQYVDTPLFPQANPDPHNCLGVFGLSLYTTERDLREVFSKYGPLTHVNIVYDQQSRRSRGFAFVYFENCDDSKEVRKRRRIRHFYNVDCPPHITQQILFLFRFIPFSPLSKRL